MFVSNVARFDLGHVNKIGKQSMPVVIGHLHQALQALCNIVEPPDGSHPLFCCPSLRR